MVAGAFVNPELVAHVEAEKRAKRIVPLEVRLAAKTDRLYGPDVENRPELGPCWEWLGAKNTDGYGVIRGDPPGAPLLLAHRVALSLAIGRPLAEGMFANHRCDNRACVRPYHLYEGTMEQNIHDMHERGHAVKPPIRRKRLG